MSARAKPNNGYQFPIARISPEILNPIWELFSRILKHLNSTCTEDLRKNLLERCKLKETAKIIDVDLRNSIAHLDFEINENGLISAKSHGERKKEINIFQKINEFIRKWMMIHLIFNEIQEHTLKPEKRLTARPEKK